MYWECYRAIITGAEVAEVLGPAFLSCIIPSLFPTISPPVSCSSSNLQSQCVLQPLHRLHWPLWALDPLFGAQKSTKDF